MKEHALPGLTELDGKPINVSAIECLGIRLCSALPRTVYLARTRSDTVARCLAGDPLDNRESALSTFPSFNWSGSPRYNLKGQRLRSFWLSNFSDDALTFYDIDGATISPVFYSGHASFDSDIERLKATYRRLDPLPLDERAENWRRINALLGRRVLKFAVFYDTSRLESERARAAFEASRVKMREVLGPLGWTFLDIPKGSPAQAGDPYWAHYDKVFLFSFFKSFLREGAGRDSVLGFSSRISHARL